ncbi:MAG: hypothetical protein M3P97_01670 [Actinomycetota bacterium]|nr:hypothetical protein [Actinomycetota bacterium]
MSRGRHEGGDQQRLQRSSVLAGVGDGVAAPALALLAGGLTRDPLGVAAVVAAQHAPWAVVAVAGGRVWAHADRRTLLGLGATLRAVAVALVGLLTLAGAETVAILAAGALAIGTGEALADHAEAEAEPPGRPTLVGLAAVGLPLGGLVYELAAALPFLLDVGVFSVAALSALSVQLPLPAPRPASSPTPTAPATGTGPALPALAPGTGPLTLVMAASAAASGAVLGVLVLFALDDLGLGAPAFGLLLAGLAAAAALGTLAAPTVGQVLGARAGLALALAVAGAGYAAAGLVADPARPLVAALALGVGTASSMVAAVLGRALLHTAAGQVVEGSHLVAFHARVWAGIPFGALLGGGLARSLGVAGLVVVSGVVCAGAALATVAVRARPHEQGRGRGTRLAGEVS